MVAFLTTERSEVVPFFRAVRAEKRGREATPQGGRSPHSRVAKRPLGCWGVTLRSSVFSLEVAPNVNRFERNLVGMVFRPCPTIVFADFCNRPPGGRAIQHGRWKFVRFGHFGGILTLQRAHEGGKGPLEVAEGLLGTP